MRSPFLTVITLLLCAALCLTGCTKAEEPALRDHPPRETEEAETTQMTQPETTPTTCIEITMDNWQEYFVARRAQDVGVDDNGHVNHRETGFGIFLKEEYLSRLDLSCDGSVCFEIVYDYTPYIVENWLGSDDCILTETEKPQGTDIQAPPGATLYVLYRGYQGWRGPQSDFNYAFCGFIGDEVFVIDGVRYMLAIEDVQVIGVQGSLLLNS